ncbi:MAG: Jag N-terminal domain-containing protein [Desulfohalobiaceae bacterium]|nr:Jag N-terminal domain-containing protein [Desulfohalobiaceae bacterium]
MSSAQRFEGKSYDAAVEKACSFYGRDKDDLEVSVIDSGSSGIFGLGGRDCVIEASPKLNKQEELENLIRATVQDIVNFLVHSCEISVEMNGSRAVVGINTEDNHGLLIGREGQTISSLEYLVNRIVSKHWQEKVYVQLDTGGYKTQQEEQIKKTAQELAQKAKSSGKPMSTKPLSSYHRRLVHVALQEDEEVQTHSKGEGPKKRVSIKPKGASRNQTEERK